MDHLPKKIGLQKNSNYRKILTTFFINPFHCELFHILRELTNGSHFFSQPINHDLWVNIGDKNFPVLREKLVDSPKY